MLKVHYALVFFNLVCIINTLNFIYNYTWSKNDYNLEVAFIRAIHPN